MKKLYSFLILPLLLSLSLGAQPIVAEKPEQVDVVIMGGGIGALTSAIYLQRAGVNTWVIEGKEPGGALAQSPKVFNWPGEVEIDGQVLVEKIRNQAEVNGAKILSEEVISVNFKDKPYTITTRDVFDESKIRTIQSKACIIALGSKPNLLGVPGESSSEGGYWTKGVYSCATCDGPLYKNKTVAVVGGGDTAVLEADYLSNIAEKVYLILRSDHFRTVEIMRKNALIKKSNVEVIYNAQVGKIEGDGNKVTHLKLSTEKQLPVDAVFIAIGSKPNTALFTDQLQLDNNGYILVSKDQQTSLPGVFAIGDVIDPVYKQAITAAGDGARAATEVERYLSHSRAIPAVVRRVANDLREIQSASELNQAIEDNKILVVDFYSPRCGPCRQIAPQLDNFAQEYSGRVPFLKVDVTQFSEFTSQYNLQGVPTVIIFKKGKVAKRATGAEPIIKLLKGLDNYID